MEKKNSHYFNNDQLLPIIIYIPIQNNNFDIEHYNLLDEITVIINIFSRKISASSKNNTYPKHIFLYLPKSIKKYAVICILKK